MLRHEVVRKISERMNISDAAGEVILDVALDAIVEGLREDGTVRIPKFGTFRRREADHDHGRERKVTFSPDLHINDLIWGDNHGNR